MAGGLWYKLQKCYGIWLRSRSVFVLVSSVMSHLSHGVGQDVDNFFMGRRHHTLAINFDNAVTHSDPAPFSDAPAHQATDLLKGQIDFFT